MDPKSERSYKLRVKQMVLPVRTIKKANSIVPTEIEETLFTIDDLRNRSCAMLSDSNLHILRAVLEYTFPKDSSIACGDGAYYRASFVNKGMWTDDDYNDLPIQSAIKFFNQINN